MSSEEQKHGTDGWFLPEPRISMAKYIDSRIKAERLLTDRILNEKEKKTLADQATLSTALDKAALTATLALDKAAASTEKALAEAKAAADERGLVIQGRIEKLEAGGAPFASRLDDSLTRLKTDVETLKSESVASGALDELQRATKAEREESRRRLRLVIIAGVFGLVTNVVITVVVALHGG